MLRAPLVIVAFLAALALAACGGDSDNSGGDKTASAPAPETSGAQTAELPKELQTKPKVKVPEGSPPKSLQTKDIVKGTGAQVKSGDAVSVQYVGVLFKNGKEFDASWDRGEPFQFTLGAGEVIPGWDKGVPGMRVGGRRELIIPAEEAYGAEGSPPVIGPNEALVFVVDVVSRGG